MGRRMRRFTNAEMEHLNALGRAGTKGPARAMRAMWDLVLRDLEGVAGMDGLRRATAGTADRTATVACLGTAR